MQQSFDPVKYFRIPYQSEKEYWELTRSVNTSLADYLLVRLAELLPKEKIEKVSSLDEVFSLAESLPEYKTTVIFLLDDFKKEVLKIS